VISTWPFLSTGLMQYGSLIYLIHLFTLSLHYICTADRWTTTSTCRFFC